MYGVAHLGSGMILGVDGAELTDSSLYDLYGPEPCYAATATCYDR